MKQYYKEVIDDEEKLKNTRLLFRDYKKMRSREKKLQEQEFETAQKSNELHAEDQPFGFITQNVNGFGNSETDRAHWFQAFGERDQHGRQDVAVIQETHEEKIEVGKFTSLYANRWGFRTGQQ
ncbi:hypothetical protein PR003_g29883 [Phytophthora rubi]|uniref:Uncharacterized protein n=1 Tax=Phytophthora rubi TaxID=129364 RepID=A0A6A3HQG3_9STRA|nr:hypothetical protein PR001_g26494 [Phytophthora rubi]KAE9273523.1 hypothetical protein PR003_g29883 [Phytophthora rubi]